MLLTRDQIQRSGSDASARAREVMVSNRRAKVSAAISAGCSLAEIAASLGLSTRTIENDVRALRQSGQLPTAAADWVEDDDAGADDIRRAMASIMDSGDNRDRVQAAKVLGQLRAVDAFVPSGGVQVNVDARQISVSVAERLKAGMRRLDAVADAENPTPTPPGMLSPGSDPTPSTGPPETKIVGVEKTACVGCGELASLSAGIAICEGCGCCGRCCGVDGRECALLGGS